jgi:hypothetical protein
MDNNSNVTLIDQLLAKTRLSELSYVSLLRSTMNNWYDPMLVRAGIKGSATLKFKDGSTLDIKKKTFSSLWSSKEMQLSLFRSAAINSKVYVKKNQVGLFYKDRKLLFNYNENATDTLSILREVFIDGRYSFLDVRGKDVVDIGAYIGDTAMYFILNGARHVYAFEPDRGRYLLAKKNITANGMGSKITLLQKKVSNGKTTNQSISLEGIVRAYKLNSAALKIDCEGHEYPILLEAKPDVLTSFDQIQIEYHMGYLNIEKRLKTIGFGVTHDTPTKPSSDFFGHMYAKRSSGND